MILKDKNIIEITEELSSEFEVAKVLRKYPKDTVLIKNVKVSIFQLSQEYVTQGIKSQNQLTVKYLKLLKKLSKLWKTQLK